MEIQTRVGLHIRQPKRERITYKYYYVKSLTQVDIPFSIGFDPQN